jgi:hypothetical protein
MMAKNRTWLSLACFVAICIAATTALQSDPLNGQSVEELAISDDVDVRSYYIVRDR